MKLALKAIAGQMTSDKTPLSTLLGVLEKPGLEQPYQHRLAVYCLGAMDEIKELVNLLQRADQINSPDRTFAIFALRNWLDRGRDQEKKLFDTKSEKGLLVSDLGYTNTEAKRIMELLRDPTFEQVFNSKEYYEDLARDLASDKVAIAELAHWRLSFIAMDILPRLKTFNAARPLAERKAAMQEVMDKINEGLLPPPTGPRKAGTGGGARPNPKGGPGVK